MIRGELAELVEELIDERIAVRRGDGRRGRSGRPASGPGDAAIVRPDGVDRGIRRRRLRRGLGAASRAARRWRPASRCCCGSCPGDAAEGGRRARGRGDRQQPVPERRSARDLPPTAPTRARAPDRRRDADRAAPWPTSASAPAMRSSSARPRGRDPRADDAAVIVASHGHDEERVLTEALRDAVPYVGLVASRVRGEAVRDSLELPDELRAQLRTPAGLELGARTPAEIALSILAEIVSVRRAAAPAPAGRADRGRPGLRDGDRGQPGERPGRARRRAPLLLRRGLPRQLRRRARAGCRGPLTRSSPASCSPPAGSRRLGEPKQLLPYGSGDAARPRARDRAASRLRPAGSRARRQRRAGPAPRSTSPAPRWSRTTTTARAARRRSPPGSAQSTGAPTLSC